MTDILKRHFLGEVEYAQHNFARLRPLLFSEDGRLWNGPADKAAFPTAGLVFSLAPELRFAASGSLWTFQVKPNARQSGDDEGKDAFMTIQVKPAVRLLDELEPLDPEPLRLLATRDGFDPGGPTGGAALPETGGGWVVTTEFERGADGLARVVNVRHLTHMRVISGSPADIAGLSTSDGRWVLPVIPTPTQDIRNWLPAPALAEQLARDLRRWFPHLPHKANAAAAAAALRDLAPALEGLAALRAPDARAALDRAVGLANEAEDFTGSLDALVETLLAAPAVARALDAEREKARAMIEEEVLASAERLETEARERLAAEQLEIREALGAEQARLDEIRTEIERGSGELAALRRQQKTETATFTKSLEGLIARAKSEPAAYAAEWLARAGLAPGAIPDDRDIASRSVPDLAVEPVSAERLGLVLSKASPIRGGAWPPFLLLDAAIRSRELVLAHGPGARDIVETWLWRLAPLTARCPAADPTVLSFRDLVAPGGGLREAITWAMARPGDPVVALLDDVDVAAGSFWLPEAARALRRPADHGLPDNLFLIALVEGDLARHGMTRERFGELYPLGFGDVEWAAPAEIDDRHQIPLDLFAPPARAGGVGERLEAHARALAPVFGAADAADISEAFEAYLGWTKLGKPAPTGDEAPFTRAARALGLEEN